LASSSARIQECPQEVPEDGPGSSGRPIHPISPTPSDRTKQHFEELQRDQSKFSVRCDAHCLYE